MLTCPGCDHAECVPEPEPDQREEGELGQHEEEGQEDVPRQPLPVALQRSPTLQYITPAYILCWHYVILILESAATQLLTQ
jgi:hypothetical protein